MDFGPQRVDNSDETDQGEATLGLLKHFILEMAGPGWVANILLADDLSGQENAPLALAAVVVLDLLQSVAHIQIQRLGIPRAGRVMRAPPDQGIGGSLDGKEAGRVG